MVNFHGATIPRGWQRTYPHFMTSEAVYGAEWYNNNGRLTPNAAWHNCTLPFTRNVIGPMDYTPCAFTDSQHPHITTHAHELALTIVFESALQNLADRPEGFLSQPTEVQHLITSLPVAWDDTRFLAGYPGESVAMARRSGNTWYVGIINGLDTEQTISVDWSFLGGGDYRATIFGDVEDEARAWSIHTDVQFPASVDLAPRGGFVAVLTAR
ncbi:MAG: glycoside hydrolase family 97 catalytic domain-containing protein, partial [Bacteroidaceae bacterium]|nr:glycoside hydrolase family 97 catalytic domain-containing protein [Bacteroidaceae bacterium]